jgi:hypothetical protein
MNNALEEVWNEEAMPCFEVGLILIHQHLLEGKEGSREEV